ncbi:ATP-binding protein [Mesorhizobium sp. ANAO-SY3R2]|uniref:ATP-binding protein n=1 Tax=Mesorhizobium sp. ANAO-SY3R2 TaxID=3166644 RepID=UPI00366E2322
MTESSAQPDVMQEFDLAPSPRVLPMLGEINLEQWRCIGELVDNAIDGFLHAVRRSEEVSDPIVHVTLPEADREDAVVQVVDNGPGMTPENLAKAVKAGWSGNNPTDNLGLFGMGFNIATARLGLTTEVWTTQTGDAEWHGLVIDFDRLQRQGNFRTPHLRSPKSDTSVHGTKIVIRRLKPAQRQWLSRSANQGLLRKRLAQAYAAMLRPSGHPIEFKLYLNNKIVKSRPFCLWNETRSAELPDLGEVSAVLPFNYPLSDKYHCVACMNWVPSSTPNPDGCPVCEGVGTLQRRSRRVHGWIGLQRYADTVDFGLDFIRNGRKIEMGSKDLFIWRGENGDEPEYPIDDPSRRGRIVGEIHLDHCRVNFAKERFDRSDPAWEEMVSLVRGEGPLRPEKARELGYSQNGSVLFRLYKAFRRMRPHSNVAGGWRRLLAVPDNAIAKELTQKFFDGHPDYQEDTHWWRLIEEAERRLLTNDTDDNEDDSAAGGLPPGLLDNPLEDRPALDTTELQPASMQDYRTQRQEAPSLSRSYVYAPAGQTFTVKAFECAAHDPDLPAAAAWCLILGDIATRTYHFLFKPRAEVFRSITLEPLDALLIELAFLTNEYVRASKEPPSYAVLLSYFREHYARTSSLDARGVTAEASDALETLAQAILANVPKGEEGKLFDALTVEQRSEVMRTLARKGIAPAGPITDGSFVTAAPRNMLGRLVEAFPELVFDNAYWDLPYSTLDYGDPQLTDRARQQLIDRATSLISDAAWLAEAAPTILGTIRKEELVRGLMSVSLIRPDREIL